jgi:Ca-activated chloride channel homolog
VGPDVNTYLLDRLGEAGRGSTQYVEPEEDVERAVGLLAAKIRYPVLTDVALDASPVRLEEIYPVRMPDVFAGEELVLFGRYSGVGAGAVRVRGRRGGRPADFTTDVTFPGESGANAYIPRLWASRKLGWLTRRVWTEGETPALVEEIRALALRYGLTTTYTSYLVKEPDVAVAQGGTRRDGTLFPSAPSSFADAPAAATGANAVRAAESARLFREASTVAGLARAEAAMAGYPVGADGATRSVAGRIFRLDGGVWSDLARPDTLEVVRVKAFSPAYFRLLAALPELVPVVRELSPVRVGGRGLSVEVGDAGADRMSGGELAGVVRRFR